METKEKLYELLEEMDIIANANDSPDNLASWHKVNGIYSPLFNEVFDFSKQYKEEDERTCLDRARNNYGYACQPEMRFGRYTKEFYLETARDNVRNGKIKSGLSKHQEKGATA